MYTVYSQGTQCGIPEFCVVYTHRGPSVGSQSSVQCTLKGDLGQDARVLCSVHSQGYLGWDARVLWSAHSQGTQDSMLGFYEVSAHREPRAAHQGVCSSEVWVSSLGLRVRHQSYLSHSTVIPGNPLHGCPDHSKCQMTPVLRASVTRGLNHSMCLRVQERKR